MRVSVWWVVAAIAASITFFYGRDFVAEIPDGFKLDVNGLPKCDSNFVTDLAKQAVANGPTSKIVHIEILSFEKIEYVKQPHQSDIETQCRADVLTNSGEQKLNYTIRKMSDGGIYVQTIFSDLGS